MIPNGVVAPCKHGTSISFRTGLRILIRYKKKIHNTYVAHINMLMIKCALQYCSGDFARLQTQFTINICSCCRDEFVLAPIYNRYGNEILC